MDIEQIKEIARTYIEKMDLCLQSGQMLLTDDDWKVVETLTELCDYIKSTRGFMEQIRNLQDIGFKYGAMNDAPCFICGYNGPNYFQPKTHLCAERHHRLYKR